MTSRAATLPDLLLPRITAREVALWAAAGALVVAVHATVYFNVPDWHVDDAAAEQRATALMIDLAPMAVAPDAVPSEMAELVDSQESLSEIQPTETVAEESVLQEVVEQTPTEVEPLKSDILDAEPLAPSETAQRPEVQTVAPEIIEQIVSELLEDPLPEVATALPTPRPDTVEPKQTAKTPVRKVEKKAPPPKSSVASRASANDAPKAAAPRPKEGSKARGESPARWQSRVNAHLNRHKRYPAGERDTGQAAVRFSIDPTGRVLAASLARSSGNGALDQAAIEMVRRASPVPPPPPAIARSRLTLTVPVRFSRR
ncbi:MAG: TonB family protein [Rhizobiaceae bacterium]|nr:TonB family protein [Rhizobiaceae bacterium]